MSLRLAQVPRIAPKRSFERRYPIKADGSSGKLEGTLAEVHVIQAEARLCRKGDEHPVHRLQRQRAGRAGGILRCRRRELSPLALDDGADIGRRFPPGEDFVEIRLQLRFGSANRLLITRRPDQAGARDRQHQDRSRRKQRIDRPAVSP